MRGSSNSSLSYKCVHPCARYIVVQQCEICSSTVVHSSMRPLDIQQYELRSICMRAQQLIDSSLPLLAAYILVPSTDIQQHEYGTDNSSGMRTASSTDASGKHLRDCECRFRDIWRHALKQALICLRKEGAAHVAQLRYCVSADLGMYGGMCLNRRLCTCVRKVRRMSSMSQRARRTYIVVVCDILQQYEDTYIVVV